MSKARLDFQTLDSSMARQPPWVWELNNNLYCFFLFLKQYNTTCKKSLTQFLFSCDKCALPVLVMCCRTALPVSCQWYWLCRSAAHPSSSMSQSSGSGSPRVTAILCKMQQATTIVQTLSGAILTS